MKKCRLVIIILVVYFIIVKYTKYSIPCPFHYITGLYCPGCGITRMILSLCKLDYYQAFKYNQLVFIMLPFIGILYTNYVYSLYKNKKPLYKYINKNTWYVIIIIVITYGILRNIYPPLSPTVIK